MVFVAGSPAQPSAHTQEQETIEMDDHLLTTVLVGGLILLAFTIVNITRFGALCPHATAPFTHYQAVTAGVAFLALAGYLHARGYPMTATGLLALGATFLVVSMVGLAVYCWRESRRAVHD
jgi:hypothetical protein